MCLTSREGYRVHSRYATHHERYVRVALVTFGLVQLAPAYLLLFCFCFSFVAYPFIAVFFLFPAGRPATRDVVFVCHVRRGSRRKTTNTKRTQRTEEEDQARISIKRFNPNPNSYVVYSDLRIEGGSQRSSPSPSPVLYNAVSRLPLKNMLWGRRGEARRYSAGQGSVIEGWSQLIRAYFSIEASF